MANNTRDETIKYIFKAEGGESIDAVEKSLEGVVEKSLGTETAFSFIKQHLEELTVAALALGTAFKAIDFGKESLNGAADVEASLSRVKALAGDAAGAFGDLDDAVEKAAKDLNVTSQTSATALGALVSQGLAAKDAIAALVPTLQLAKIAQIDVGTAAQEVAQALNAFKIPASESQTVVDELTAASHGAAGGLAAMSSAAVQLAPDAETLKLSFTDVVSILGVLNSRGLDTEKSVRGLRTVFQDLENPASSLRQQLLALGDGTDDFGAAIAALTSGTPRANEALTTLKGPALALVETLGQAGPDALTKFSAGLEQAQGSASKTAAVLDDNLKGAATRFGNAVDDLGEKLLKPILGPLKDELLKLAAQFTAFSESEDFKEIQTAIGEMATNAAKALDEFIKNVKWEDLAKDGKAAVQGLSTEFETLAANAKSTAEKINAVFDALGVAYHGVRGTVDGVVGAVAAVDAAVVDSVAPLAKELDNVAQTGGLASAAFDVMSNSANALKDEALQQLDDQTTLLRGNLRGLGYDTDATTTSTTKHGTAAAEAAPKVKQHADAAAAAGAALLPLPDYLGLATKSTDDLGTAAKATVPYLAAMSAEAIHLGGGPLLDARQALADASLAFADLQRAGNATPEAMATASRAVVDASRTLDQLEKSAQGAATGVTTAWVTLRTKSQEQLKGLAQDALEAFNTINAAAANTAAGLADRQNAFLAYARAALAAYAQADEGTRQAKEAELEQKAAVLGVTDALADLEKQSNSSQAALVSDSNRGAAALNKELEAADNLAGKLHGGGGGSGDGSVSGAVQATGEAAAEAQRQFTEWGAESGKTAQQLGADTSHANEGMQALAQGIGDARAQYLAVSDAAAKFYDLALKGNFDIGHSDDGSGFDRVARAMQAALQATDDAIAANRAQLQGMLDAANKVGTESVDDFTKLGGAAKYTESQLETMIASIQAGTYQVGLLGQQDLAPLQAALEAAKQRVDALKAASEAAQQQLADMGAQLQDDLDNASGNQEAVEDRRYKKQLADLQAAAQTAGQLNSAQYQIDVENANKLHALKMQQIEQQAKAAAGAPSSGAGVESGPAAGSNAGGSSGSSAGSSSGGKIDTKTTVSPASATALGTLNLNHTITVNIPAGAGLKGLSDADMQAIADHVVSTTAPTLANAVLRQINYAQRNSI